jgi:hypothetical protein
MKVTNKTLPAVKQRTAVAVVIPTVDTAQITADATAAAKDAAIAEVKPIADAAKSTANAASSTATAAKNAADGVAQTLADNTLTQAQKDAMQDSFAGALDGSFSVLQTRVSKAENGIKDGASKVEDLSNSVNAFKSDVADDFGDLAELVIAHDATLASGVDAKYFTEA